MAVSEIDTAPGRRAAFSIRLFVAVLFVYLLSGPPFLGYDGGIMYQVSEHLVTRHTLVIQDPIYHISQPYSPYGLGTSLLLLPLVFIGYLFLNNAAALILLYLPLITALTVVALNLVLIELRIPAGRALWLSLAFAFATMAWHYASVLFSEPLVMLTAVLGWLWLLIFRRTGGRRWLLAAGGALGFAVLAREAALLLTVLPLSLYAGWLILQRQPDLRGRALDLAFYAGPLAFGCLAAVAYDVFRYGRPLAGPYFKAWAWLATPILKGLYGLLLSPGGGLFVFVPLLLLSLLAFPRFFQRWRADAILVGGIVGLHLLFYATWYDWEGGATWGPRYLLPLIPLLIVPLGFLEGRRWAITIGGFAAVSLGIELVGQLVPYGLYYGAVVPQVAAQLGICHCIPNPGPEIVPVQDVIHFRWDYAVLPYQVRLLFHGVAAPAWGPIAYAVAPLLAIDAILIGRLASCALRPASNLALPAPSRR